MKHRIYILLGTLVIFLGFFGLKAQVGRAGLDGYTVMRLESVWTTGIISDWVGPGGIEVADVNQDGTADIISCTYSHAYVLNETLPDIYDTIWYSEEISCRALATGDRNSDGINELYFATGDGQVLIFDGDDFQKIGSFYLPNNIPANDIQVANVDGDAAPEIILTRSDSTFVYNANSFAKEWQAGGFGGDQVAIGNIDADPDIEIVVNGNPAHVLNASLQTQEWAYSGGFGTSMDLGDVDADGRAEIAYVEEWENAYVYDAETMTLKWQRENLFDLEVVKVADVDGDAISEVIIGDGQWGNVSGYQGNNGADLWSIGNPEHGVSGIGIGDANNDDINEILWGAGLSSSGDDALFIGSWISETVQWRSEDLDGPLYAAAGDLDNDGTQEIVMASMSTGSGYQGGTLHIYDGPTHQLEWSTVIAGSFFDISHLAVAQLDADPALEILVGGNNWYDTRLQVYDGQTLTLEWQSPEMGSYGPCCLTVTNLDTDAVEEIILGLDNSNVQVLNGASSIIQWDSGPLDGWVYDFATGDLDGNGKQDLAIATELSVYVFEVGTWTQLLHEPLDSGNYVSDAQVAIANEDLTGMGELLLFTNNDANNNLLQAWLGATNALLWEQTLSNIFELNDLTVNDFDADGSQEFALLGSYAPAYGQDSRSFFWVGASTYPTFWEYKMQGDLGAINGVTLSDVDGDEQVELLLGSSSLIQVNEIVSTPVVFRNMYLPLIVYEIPPVVTNQLFGTVTENGVPAPDVTVLLRFYDGASWSTLMTTMTSADGAYTFSGIPALNPGQLYYVRYNNYTNPNRLYTWHTQTLDSFNAGAQIRIGDFDIANLALVSPNFGDTVSLPTTFQWVPRPNSPTDSYELDIFDPTDYEPYAYTNPPLGYVGQYTVTELPSGFNDSDEYNWEIWIYSPDGGYGTSYEVRTIYFNDLLLDQSLAAPFLLHKPLLDVDPR